MAPVAMAESDLARTDSLAVNVVMGFPPLSGLHGDKPPTEAHHGAHDHAHNRFGLVEPLPAHQEADGEGLSECVARRDVEQGFKVDFDVDGDGLCCSQEDVPPD